MKSSLHPFVCSAPTLVRWPVFTACGMVALLLGGCGPATRPSPVPTVEWNQQKYGATPERRSLSAVNITTDKGWVVARQKDSAAPAANPPTIRTSHLGVGGMDCGDCQHLIANELGKLAGVRQARVSQSPPETVVEYDPGKLTDKQIEGTVAGLGLWPKPLP